MAPKIQRHLRLYETTNLISRAAFIGTASEFFSVTSGSRLIVTLNIKQIDPGTTVTVKALNGYDLDETFDEILTFSSSSVGFVKRVLTDFHNLVQIDAVVTGGNADFSIGVTLADNAMTTRIENAEIEVEIDHRTDRFGRYSSARIGDGTDEMEVNTDGSINVNIVSTPGLTAEEIRSVFNSIPAVASGSETLLVTYTIPPGKSAKLQRLEFSGTNVATFNLYLNGALIGVTRTYHGGDLSGRMEFIGGSEEGLPLYAGDILTLRVYHIRPFTGDFEGRIQFLEIG